MRFLLTFVVFLVLLSTAFANPLTPTELQLVQHVQSSQTEALHLLETLVNINSGSTNPAGVQQVGVILRSELQQLGFSTHWVEEPVSMHRGGTLVATHTGSSSRRLLLIGHLDTVFPPDSPFQKFSRQGGTATGPGIIDDKGGDVVLLFALKALAEVGLLNNLNITVVLTGDEEDSGKPAEISRGPLILAAKQNDIALDFEPSTHLSTATVGRRGISSWVIRTSAQGHHSASMFQDKTSYGAIFELSRIINALRTALSATAHISFNPSVIAGGTVSSFNKESSSANATGATNVIASSAVASGDFRYVDLPQKNNTEHVIRTIIAQHLPGTQAEIVFEDGIPPMAITKNNLALLDAYSDVSEALGGGKVSAIDADLRGAADISYISTITTANLSGLGPLGTGLHSTHETLNIESLKTQTQRAAIFIYRLGNGMVDVQPN